MTKIGKFTLFVAVLGGLCVMLMLFGARLGLWAPTTGFGFYRTYLNPLGAVIAVMGVLTLLMHFKRKEKAGLLAGGAAVIIGMACLAPMIAGAINPPVRAAPIHDISTDTTNPPAFEVLDETRAGARNSLKYGGPELAKVQSAAYPDIAPLTTELSADAAYQKALTVAHEMGWEIVTSNTERRRFEAVARTPVFYFADDVVLVVTPQGDGSRVDMRSVSRVGRSDQGVNAKRILSFQKQFRG
ncbi:DUF1499 domain-containing protein [Labrenzia sp. CE80]|uniref:DUF1499 domain-containing protein n=1 Tax=Labrenzia sp. CE80 TaxID=1788986 RepID=UPI00129AACFE|nr:DUF1499 domain-containing protein [Labrenzia sp. CE80]